MDNRIKERLTGALILVAALVILVPEMLSGPARQSASTDAPPASPAAEGPPLRSYRLDLDAPADNRPAAQSSLNVQSPQAESAAPAVAQPQDSRAPSPQVVAPVVSAPAAAAPSATAKTGAKTAAPGGSAGWSVQVGSFAQRDNAQRYAQELSRKGFSAEVSSSTSKGRELFRVRVGPAADRESAAALQARLAAAGHRGSLIAP